MSPQLAGSAHSRRWSTRRPAHSRSLAVGLQRHGVSGQWVPAEALKDFLHHYPVIPISIAIPGTKVLRV